MSNNAYYDYEDDQEFAGYTPTTIDPSPWTLFGTLIVCGAVVLVAVSFLFLRRSRSKRAARHLAQITRLTTLQKKAQQEHEETMHDAVEISVTTESLDSYLRKRQRSLRVSSRLRGWNRIADVLEEEESLKVQKAFAAPPPSRAVAEDVLDRDLLERGGLVHQLSHQFLCGPTTQVEVDDESSVVTEATGDYELMGSHPSNDKTTSSEERPRKSSCAYFPYLLRYDKITKKLLKLAVPYSISSAIDSLCSVLTLSLIGQQLGTHSLSAYVMVTYLLQLTTMFLDGILTTIATVASQAIGAENYALAGQYTQLAVLLYELLFVPQLALWWTRVEGVLLWMEFEEQDAEIAQRFAHVYMIFLMVHCVSSAFTSLLEIGGYEKFTAVADICHSVSTLVVLAGVIIYGTVPFTANDKPVTLRVVAIIWILMDILFLVIKVVYMRFKEKWWSQYMPGLVGSLSFTNYRAVKNFAKTAVPQSVGYVLSYGEWEIIFLIASSLGPAEAAAWGILGEVWEAQEQLTYSWGDAAEVVCAFFLGAGKAAEAELSAHKALAFGTIGSIVASVILLSVSRQLPGWITKDEVLQDMVEQLLPLVAFGNISMAVGTVSWQLIGAQARYSLATAVQFIGSWLVTLPLAVISSFSLNWNLTGLVSAIVIGNMVSGMMNFTILCCTNWERQTVRIMKKNEEEEEESDDEDGIMVEGDVAMQPVERPALTTAGSF